MVTINMLSLRNYQRLTVHALRGVMKYERTSNIHMSACVSNCDPCSPCPPPSDPCKSGGGRGGGGGGGGGGGSCGKLSGPGGGKGKHQITFKPYVAPCYKNHDQKNMGLKRPMSPHLTVYAPTLPSLTSIGQRITGSITTMYALLLAGGSLFLSNGVDTYVSMIQSLDLSRPFIFILKLLLATPFAYHYFCGIRFVAWNAGKWLTMKEVYGTARQSFILAGATALIFALL